MAKSIGGKAPRSYKQFGGAPPMGKTQAPVAKKMGNTAKGFVFKGTAGAPEGAHRSKSPAHRVNRQFGMKV